MDVTASTKKTDDVASLIESAENTALPVPEQKPVSPELVMQIQKALAGMAYKDIKVDGICGDATRTAIRAFEKSYRMTVTGEPSEKLLKKLKSIGAA
jgi:peptidoglycan hydrolase-like protein with peptidoglycan-binding domain